MDAVLKLYKVIIETMEEVHLNAHDEYGLKASGIVTALEKFGWSLARASTLWVRREYSKVSVAGKS